MLIDTKRQITYDSANMRHLEPSLQTQKVEGRGLGVGEGDGEYWSSPSQFRKMNEFCGWIVIMVAHHRTVHLKAVKMVKFMLCVFYHN